MRTIWRDLPIARKALIVVAIPVLPLIVTAVLYVRSADEYNVARADAERAWQNLVTQTELNAAIFEVESSVRGFVLSGNQDILDQYRHASSEIEARLTSLETATRDPAQRARLPQLRALVAARLAALEDVLAANETSGLNSPDMLRHVERGAGTMRELHAIMDETSGNQLRVLSARAERVREAQTRSTAIVLIGALVGVLGGLAAAWLFTTGITRRLTLATGNMALLSTGQPVVPVEASGDEIGTLTAGTERAAALLSERDAQLRARMRELEHLTRELEAFSYSVSHDLRAPLRHVAGFASMLDKSAAEVLTDQQRRYTRTIVDAAARMGRLIDDLLAFSRTSRAELRQVPVDIGTVVHDVQQQLKAESNGRNIMWRVQPLPRVIGDPAMLRVVFDNLLTNAVKYTSPREQAVIEIGAQPSDNGESVVYVRDNGVGFDMQYEHKLFGVFQRLHSSDEFEGTGIGLATVRRIVSRHGGRAWAEGRPGEGATFYVALPNRENAA